MPRFCFSDLLVPLEPLGIPFSFAEGEGPRIEKPIASRADIESLREVEPRESMAFTLEAIRLLRRELEVPLIGFAGAPFTLASYAVEGGPSKNFERTKALMYEDPSSWHLLASKLARVVKDYLIAQIEAGAQAVQLFDSWVGALSPRTIESWSFPTAVISWALSRGLEHRASTSAREPRDCSARCGTQGADVVGIDWRIDLDRGWDIAGGDVAVQGNLDPLALLAPPELLLERADTVLRQAGGRPGHVFNLGHGILPATPVENVALLVEHVHRETARPARKP